MEIEYTARYLKDYRSIQDKRAQKETDKVEKRIREAENFLDLFKTLDIKKYDPGIGGYRIRYSGKPEWRIRFDLVENPNKKGEQMVKLQLVLPREKYEKYAHKKIEESVTDKSYKILVTERQLKLLKNYLDQIL